MCTDGYRSVGPFVREDSQIEDRIGLEEGGGGGISRGATCIDGNPGTLSESVLAPRTNREWQFDQHNLKVWMQGLDYGQV